MPWESGNYPDISGIMSRVASQLQNTSFMGAGDEWDLEQYYSDGSGLYPYTSAVNEFGNGEAWTFKVPGPTKTGDYYMNLAYNLYAGRNNNTANIYIGFKKNPPLSGWSTGVLTYKGSFSGAGIDYAYGDVVSDSLDADALYTCISGYNSSSTQPENDNQHWRAQLTTYAKDFYERTDGVGQVGTTFMSKCKREDSTNGITYWMIANAKRLILVLKSDARYAILYGGGYDSFMPMNINPYQYFITFNHGTSTDPYTDLDMFNFPNTTYESPLGVTYLMRDRTDAIYSTSSSSYTVKQHNYSRKNNGKYILSPVYLTFHGGAGQFDKANLYGTVDGMFLLDNDNLISEDLITIDSVDYLCVENVYRSTSSRFCAIRLS